MSTLALAVLCIPSGIAAAQPEGLLCKVRWGRLSRVFGEGLTLIIK